MYMLNFLFDFGNPNGLFVDNAPAGNPLVNSKHWLRRPAPSAPPGFNPEAVPAPAWMDLGPAGALRIPRAPAGPGNPPEHDVIVRFAPDLTVAAVIAANATALLVLAFGRPVTLQQPFASPFTSAGHTLTTYSIDLGQRVAGNVGWFHNLGPIDPATRPAPGSDVSHRYEFAVGIRVISGGQTREYGEDPEFDIDG